MADREKVEKLEERMSKPRLIEPVLERTLYAIVNEVVSARAKFPRNRRLLVALTEEVGELAKALLQNKSNDEIVKEAVQVAAVAVRIIEEGDADFADITPEESKP